MTGRRLYDHFTDTAANEPAYSYDRTQLPHREEPARAWAFLSRRDRAIWNAMARRITPKVKKRVQL